MEIFKKELVMVLFGWTSYNMFLYVSEYRENRKKGVTLLFKQFIKNNWPIWIYSTWVTIGMYAYGSEIIEAINSLFKLELVWMPSLYLFTGVFTEVIFKVYDKYVKK